MQLTKNVKLKLTKEYEMKKLMIVLAAVVFGTAIMAADAVKTEVKADTAKTAVTAPAVVAPVVAPVTAPVAVVCADCAKLNKDKKAGDVAKLCPVCQKKADEAKKAVKPADVKPVEVKK